MKLYSFCAFLPKKNDLVVVSSKKVLRCHGQQYCFRKKSEPLKPVTKPKQAASIMKSREAVSFVMGE